MLEVLAPEEIARRLSEGLDGWEYDADCLVHSVQSRTFADGIRLVDSVAAVADAIDHHPDIDIRWTTVTFRLWTHVVGGVTSRDFRLAREIDRLVATR
ncbi:MAG: 4a-hydroxytetrahydrobiopterin dehydratase [Nocardioidaceae bacterium]